MFFNRPIDQAFEFIFFGATVIYVNCCRNKSINKDKEIKSEQVVERNIIMIMLDNYLFAFHQIYLHYQIKLISRQDVSPALITQRMRINFFEAQFN